MKALPKHFDFLVVGAGIAGLRAAIELAPAGTVLVLAKNELTESATQYAQGGIAVALSDEDEISLHLQDTLVAGDGLCNMEAAQVLVEEGPERIQELIDWGTQFDRSGTKLTFTREGAHSRSRILHAHGDSTGREIGRALYAKAATLPNITFSEFEFTANLLLEGQSLEDKSLDGKSEAGQRVSGAMLLDADGNSHTVSASAVLLATGGLGQVYRETTNPGVATGDGVAMAWRCGAAISDMEFVQFHPTALYLTGAPRFLLSEALRGEGAYLRNMEMHRFMAKYHPLAELAPRDVVSRAIAHELEMSAAKDAVVYLDMTHLDADQLRKRFPRIYSTCMEYNLDIAIDLVPVRPAAHYAMGGVRTDLEGRTSIPGLYAAGEAACTGVHGANRLASNSLLEGLVYGARAGGSMREHAGKHVPAASGKPQSAPVGPSDDAAAEAAIMKIRDLMWRNVGIVRDRAGLIQAIAELQRIRDALPPPGTRRICEAHNMAEVGLLIARPALARLESRGAHYRTDYPTHNDESFMMHSVVWEDRVAFQ